MTGQIGAEEIAATARLVRPHIRRTPLLEVHPDGAGPPVVLKLEHLHPSPTERVAVVITGANLTPADTMFPTDRSR